MSFISPAPESRSFGTRRRSRGQWHGETADGTRSPESLVPGEDKREKIVEKGPMKIDAAPVPGVMDAINQTLKKQKEAGGAGKAKKEEHRRRDSAWTHRKKPQGLDVFFCSRRTAADVNQGPRILHSHRLEAEKKAKAMKALRREEEIKDEEDDTYQILDDKGLGNFMVRTPRTDKMEVMDIMKNTVKTAASQAGSRVSSRTVIGDKLFTNKELKFDSLGGMKVQACSEELMEPGVKLTLQRPATVYVALSKSPNETVSETDCALPLGRPVALLNAAEPEFSDDVAPVAEIKRKERHVGRGVFKDPDNRHIEVPRPPAGLETCLVFVGVTRTSALRLLDEVQKAVVPDFHAPVFGEVLLTAGSDAFLDDVLFKTPTLFNWFASKKAFPKLVFNIQGEQGSQAVALRRPGDACLDAGSATLENKWNIEGPTKQEELEAPALDRLDPVGQRVAHELIEAILKKAEAGEKLSNKEKRLLEKHNEKNAEYKNEDDEPVGGLHAFTITLEANTHFGWPTTGVGGKLEPPTAGDAFVCNNFTLSAPKQTLFDNASVTIVQGHRYGILGPNGQAQLGAASGRERGKTTLLRHIAAREMPVPLNWDVILVEQEAKATERSAVEEVLAADLKAAELIKREAELLQKLEDMEEAMEKGQEISAEEVERTRLDLENTSAELEAIGADSAEARVRKILCGLGFTNGAPDEDRFSMDRPVVQFSGGWRMRISLAKALFLQPKLLMLDEPTNHLDLDAVLLPVSQGVLWLDNYLSEQYPHAVVVVSHDADFLDNICTDILHLEDKKLIHYRGDYTAFKKMHEQQRATMDKEYKKQQDELKALKKKGMTKEEAEAKVKEKFKLSSLDEQRKDYIVKFKFKGHGMDRTLGLNVSEVAFSYDGKEPWLLEEVEIGVDCGSRIAIVGPNGAGKSTILNLMMQQLEPCLGEVSVSKGIRVKQYHQHFEELLPLDKTGVDYLKDAFNLKTPENARAVLGQFGLPGGSHFTKIGNLSGGQKARVAFAALMLMEPHIIILDEPTNHLDIESVEALTTAISNFNGGLVLVSHDARLITEVDCELWVCEDGGCYRFETWLENSLGRLVIRKGGLRPFQTQEKDFDGYRDKVLRQLEERQEEVERMEQKRREERAKKRAMPGGTRGRAR
ncbi:ABC transporter F family member 4 (ABC transporter ABCF.4) (AtABCF4) (GCN20-type ATP-binding cassette protein GCN4) [Durusdinium trenchii]|uniref:ABC transporter F family member 4 (ABC transporter ABCF.4) (AtABCF4) (GCN20-type ATP-binding cassette protein GCN4) n=1 Tax=Durusdinium trenchii TaxID=1381693 RepID=A0ABP0SMF4_9DINO